MENSLHLTAAELAGLPGLPTSEFRTRAKLAKLQVPSRLREGRHGGGGREYEVAKLPTETRRALLVLQRTQSRPPADLPVATAVQVSAAIPASIDRPAVVNNAVALPAGRPAPTRLEAACADARVVLVRRLVDAGRNGDLVSRAAEALAADLSAGNAPRELLAVAEAANRRPRIGAGVPMSARTLFRWVGLWRTGGWWALLPRPTQPSPLTALTDDVAAVVTAYMSAQGCARNLTECAQRVNDALGRPWDDWRRLYDQARRALPKVDKVRLIKARHTGAERAALLPFKRRDTGVLKPLDVVVIDGHTFKAKVRHPDHGQPFAPEVTLGIDAATRRILGWSASLSESQIAVGDCIRHMVSRNGVPALVYTDNGKGETAKTLDCDVVGLFARLGSEHRTGLPGHPQGHGLIERSWRTHMIRCARQFGSYQGGDVDERTLRKVTLELQREQRALKRQAQGDGQGSGTGEIVALSPKVPGWQRFLDAVQEEVDRYNSRHRHRGLPKHADGEHAGRHMTPDEAWSLMLDPADQVMLDAASLRQVFMPAVLRVAQRGEVRWLNAHYFNAELMQVDGEQVRVHYDIHDASRVWVWTVDGRFVCEAEAGANKMGYFPAPQIERARERRVLGMVKRREAQIETALRELQPGAALLPHAPASQLEILPPGQLGRSRATQQVERIEPGEIKTPATARDRRPASDRPGSFDSGAHRYEWLMQHRDRWQADDAEWLAAFTSSADYRDLRDYFASRGIAWAGGDDSAFKHAG